MTRIEPDTAATTQTRYEWMDLVRGVAIILVLIQHSVTVPQWDGYTGSPILESFNDALAPYRVPLLLILSGLLLTKSLDKPLPTYAAGKIRHIVWPLAVWTGVLAVLTVTLSDDPVNLLAPRHLWFLMVLIACYIIGPFTKWIPAWPIGLALYGFAVLAPGVSDTGYVIASYGAFFFFGAALRPLLGRWQSAPGAVAAGLAVVAVTWGIWQAASGGDAPYWAAFPMGLVGALALLWAAPRVPQNAWLQWVGRTSIVFYTAHAAIMIAVWALLRELDVTQPELVSLILFAVSLPLCIWLARQRWLRWLFEFPKIGRNR